MSYEKILARLEASKEKCARLKSECVLLEGAIQEYTRAWDAAGEIWNAACEAEDNGKRAKARELWALLAPFDDEAATRLAELS
tara:strand:- start:8191 stop:8439 length:249 start_codon:yes stop_codon:yes gene_type:complete